MKWVGTSLLRQWANRRNCQETLPELARKLIRAKSNSLKSIKFPSGENISIGGWDGILELVIKQNTYQKEYLYGNSGQVQIYFR
jgi:hypothetical protein